MKIPVLQYFMFDEPSIWVSLATIVTLISTVYLGIAEVIGNHLEYSKFANSSNSIKKPSTKQGIKLSSRTGMLILYTPAFLVGVVTFFVFPGGDLRFILVKFAVTFHFFKRDFEVLFVHKYSGGMVLGSIILISIFYFYVAASMIVVHYLSLSLHEPSIDLKYIGSIMYIVGIIGSFYHHNVLSKLRKEGEKEYKIPKGGLFGLVICPHYFFEIMIFWGLSFISQTPMAFAIALGDSCYLIGRSYETRKWYVNKFDDFPKRIKCVIPYVF